MARRDTQEYKVRLTDEAREMIQLLQDYYGLSISSTLELVIREQARALGLWPPVPKKPRK